MAENTPNDASTTPAKKTRKHKDRSRLQDTTPPTTLVGTVRFRLRTIPEKAIETETTRSDKKISYAEVVPWRTMNMADLLKRMENERLAVSPQTARMVLETALDTIIRCLKEGNQVTLDNYLSFGLSMPGRVDPFHPEVRGKKSLQPWVRCAPAMIDAINKGTQVVRMGVTQPVAEQLPSANRLKNLYGKPNA